MASGFDIESYRHLYPFKSRYLDRKGLKYHYIDEGAGKTVIMVHGNPTWSFYYRDLVLALRDRWRCVVPDHIGCGLSDKPDDSAYDYRLKSRVDDLEALVDDLGLEEPVTLVVHDWGGAIGLGWAVRHPGMVGRLVILNTGAFFLPRSKAFPAALWLVRNTPLGAFLVRAFNAFSFSASFVCAKKGLAPDVRLAYRAPYNSWANRIATLRFVQDIPLGPSDPSYSTIDGIQKGLSAFRNIPVLICWGLLDFVFDRHFLEEWRRRLPNADVHAWDDAGHFVLEDKFSEVSGLVREFLLSTATGKGSE